MSCGSCVLCDTYFIKDYPQFDVYYKTTSHSNTLIINFIRKILNWDINEDSNSRYLCQPCYSIFEELDYAELTCTRLKKQLSERSISNRYNNFVKDSSTQTVDVPEDNIEDFSETLLETLKTETNITKSPEPEIYQPSDPEPDTNDEFLNKIVEERKTKSYQCTICSKSFSTKNGLNLHIQRQHRNIKETSNIVEDRSLKLECDVVIEESLKSEPEQTELQELIENVKTSTKTKLRSGRKKQSVVKPLKYSCPQCPKMWRTVGELRNHVATHSNLRPYICEVCGQAYKHKQALDIHVGMHNGINPFSCNYCHKAFTQKGALQRHLPIHTGEAPYQVYFLILYTYSSVYNSIFFSIFLV